MKKKEGNQKILGAKTISYDGIEFKSEFEWKCYLLLKDSGLPFGYEKYRCVLMPGFKDNNVHELSWNKKKKMFDDKPMKRTQDMTYTPDFVVELENEVIYIEAKGYPNDRFPMKHKLFLKYLSMLSQANGKKYSYVIVKTLMQIQDIIKQLKERSGLHSDKRQ